MRRRVVSWAWDYLVVLAWLAGLFLAVGLPAMTGLLDLEALWATPLRAELAVATFTVMPVFVYLVVSEAGSGRATVGKRRTALAVHAVDGDLRLRSVLVRNTVKLTPWQLGHMAALRFAAAGDDIPSAAVWFLAASLVTFVAVVVPVSSGRRGLHDWLAGTVVVARTAEREECPWDTVSRS